MIASIADFAPRGVEAGTGLALQDTVGRFLFFLAGTRHRCPPGQLFYAGIGGHREPGESWLACARREAREEIGAEIDILPSPVTWYIPQQAPVQQVNLMDRPRPLALYEMLHAPDAPRAGQRYRLVIYEARLQALPVSLAPEEVRGLIALTKEQVVRGLALKPTLQQLLSEDAVIVAGAEDVDPQTRLFPLGTAAALGQILRHL